eukprot:m.309301 g.309301  ORF g.309301 m.309301 type:complete len:389 (+) comp22826_c0_seq1:664-1830(+)
MIDTLALLELANSSLREDLASARSIASKQAASFKRQLANAQRQLADAESVFDQQRLEMQVEARALADQLAQTKAAARTRHSQLAQQLDAAKARSQDLEKELILQQRKHEHHNDKVQAENRASLQQALDKCAAAEALCQDRQGQIDLLQGMLTSHINASAASAAASEQAESTQIAALRAELAARPSRDDFERQTAALEQLSTKEVQKSQALQRASTELTTLRRQMELRENAHATLASENKKLKVQLAREQSKTADFQVCASTAAHATRRIEELEQAVVREQCSSRFLRQQIEERTQMMALAQAQTQESHLAFQKLLASNVASGAHPRELCEELMAAQNRVRSLQTAECVLENEICELQAEIDGLVISLGHQRDINARLTTELQRVLAVL